MARRAGRGSFSLLAAQDRFSSIAASCWAAPQAIHCRGGGRRRAVERQHPSQHPRRPARRAAPARGHDLRAWQRATHTPAISLCGIQHLLHRGVPHTVRRAAGRAVRGAGRAVCFASRRARTMGTKAPPSGAHTAREATCPGMRSVLLRGRAPAFPLRMLNGRRRPHLQRLPHAAGGMSAAPTSAPT